MVSAVRAGADRVRDGPAEGLAGGGLDGAGGDEEVLGGLAGPLLLGLGLLAGFVLVVMVDPSSLSDIFSLAIQGRRRFQKKGSLLP